MEKNDAFLGNGWSFPPVFYANGAQVAMVSGEEDIRQSLGLLLSTTMGERVLQSAYGSDLQRFMFEEIDQSLVNGLEHMIYNSLLQNEPRIQVESVTVDDSMANEGCVRITVDYTVRTTNNRYNLVYPFYINEASSV